jgi:hypothetical protein
MTILATIAVSPFVLMAYYALVSSVTVAVTILTIILVSITSKRFRALLAERPHITTTVEAFILLIISLLFGGMYWKNELWLSADLYIWNNTLLVGLMILGLLLTFRNFSTANPFVRRSTMLVPIITVSLLVTLPVGTFAPEVMDPLMIKWSVLCGLALNGADALHAFVSGLPAIRRFHSVERHLKEVGHRIREIQPLTAWVTGNKAGDELARMLKTAQQWHSAAMQSASANKLKEAENQIVISEIELSEITRRIGDEQATWLHETKSERLRRLRGEIEDLIGIYGERKLQTARLIELGDEVAQLAELGTEALTAETADRYRKLGEELGELTAALRFQDNVGAELDRSEAELASQASIVGLGRVLDLDTSRLQRTVTEASEPLEKVRMRDYRAMDELVDLVQNVRDRVEQANQSRNELLARIAARWVRNEYVDGAVVVYCPKHCKTDEAARGAVELQWNKLDQDRFGIIISGSLVTPQGDGKVTIQKHPDESVTRSVFFITGVKPGKGVLSLRSDDVSLTRFSDDIQVRVVPTRTDLVKESSLWAAPTGAVILLGALYAGEDVQTFGPVAASAGAALGFMIFGFRYMTGLRPYR